MSLVLPAVLNYWQMHTVHRHFYRDAATIMWIRLWGGDMDLWGWDGVCLFVCLGFNSTFSTNRLYRAI